jgi:flagellar protein FlgJ
MTPEEFYAQYMPYAQGVSQRTGLDPRLVLAQAALETGYGKSAPNSNFFGIKSHGRPGGQTLQTSEFEGGRMVGQPASFRGYESPAQSFQDYGEFIMSNPRYEGVRSADGLGEQIAAMANSGYATDPQYGAKLASIATRFNPDSPAIIGADAMRAIGKQPMQGRASTQGELPMMQEEQQPRGLLGTLGIQKMEEGAPGETGQRFYERDTFKDTAATLAQAFAGLGNNPTLQKAAESVAGQRTELKARNKTIEYLRANGREDLAGMIEQGMISGKDAAGVMLAKPKDDSTAAMQNYAAYQRILKEQGPEAASEFLNMANPGGNIDIDMGGGGKFEEAFAKDDAAALAAVSGAGMQAMRNMGRIDELDRLLQAAPSGAEGYLKGIAGQYGINTEGLNDIQAATALINSLVPEQRQPGSGPMSDADLELFKQSLPRIINQPGGNSQIISTMRAIAGYDAQGAEIVQQLRAGEIDRQTAFQMLQSRQNPLSAFKPPAAGGSANPASAVDEINSILGG